MTEREIKNAVTLRAAREKHGYTAEQLAKLTGMSRTKITMMELGERRIPLSAAVEIAKALHYSLDDLFLDGEHLDNPELMIVTRKDADHIMDAFYKLQVALLEKFRK